MSDVIDDTSQSPWDSDLASAFEDEETRAKVSEFLGNTVQPYVTKLEQDSKPDRDASILWEQFNNEPVSTTIQVIRELYGEDKADAFAEILKGESDQGNETETTKPEDTTATETTTPPNTPEDRTVTFEQLPPEVQEIIQGQKLEESRKAYYAEIDRLKDEHAEELPKDEDGNPRLNADTFHPFVVAADGNFDEAYKGFQSWIESARKEAGLVDASTETETDGPPTTIDSRARDASARVPEKREHMTFDDALDEMFNDLKAPPPTV